MPLRGFERILRNEIWFSRPSSWPDRWDSRLPASLGHNFSCSDLESLKESLLTTEHINRHAHLVNCWHISNEESPDMWREYGDVPNGIAIQSTVADVEYCISMHGSGKVEYYDPSEIMPPQPLFGARAVLFKRKQFSFEKEFRIWRLDEGFLTRIQRNDPFLECALSKGCLVHVSDISRLIRRIVLAPGASSQTRKVLEDLCSSYRRTWIHRCIQQSVLEPAATSASPSRITSLCPDNTSSCTKIRLGARS